MAELPPTVPALGWFKDAGDELRRSLSGAHPDAAAITPEMLGSAIASAMKANPLRYAAKEAAVAVRTPVIQVPLAVSGIRARLQAPLLRLASCLGTGGQIR